MNTPRFLVIIKSGACVKPWGITPVDQEGLSAPRFHLIILKPCLVPIDAPTKVAGLVIPVNPTSAAEANATPSLFQVPALPPAFQLQQT